MDISIFNTGERPAHENGHPPCLPPQFLSDFACSGYSLLSERSNRPTTVERLCRSQIRSCICRHRHRCLDLAYSASFSMVNDAYAAKDVTQSVFVVLAQNAGNSPPARPWLVGCTTKNSWRSTAPLPGITIRQPLRPRFDCLPEQVLLRPLRLTLDRASRENPSALSDTLADRG